MKFVIFDMDGVLVDSEPVIEMAAIMFFEEIGVTAISEDFKPFIGMGEDRYIGGVCEKYGIVYKPSIKERVYEIYQEIVARYLKKYEGTIPLLKKLVNSGYKLALASSADRVKINANLAVAGIDRAVFSAIVSGEDVDNKKPAPDIFLKSAQMLSASPVDCVVVEDATNGIQAAKSAGMKCIGITTSFKENVLKIAGADEVCRDIDLIYDIVTEKLREQK